MRSPLFKNITAADKTGTPLTVGIKSRSLVARRNICSRCRVADRDGVDKDSFHSRVGRERWPFLIPIAANSPTISGSNVGGLVLHHSIDFFVELKVLARIVFNCIPDGLTNGCGGGFAAADSG